MQSVTSDPAVEREFRDWLHSAHSPAHSRRTAAVHAAFFLPSLRPGMRLLDVGCGPGSITLGLAEAVAPAEVVGVDANPRAVAAATQAHATNIRFEVADLYRLPFPDHSFDAVFMHAVLQHVPDAREALRRVARVLRPGGVIGVADADYDGAIIWPATRPMLEAQRLMRAVRRYSGGDFRIGKKLGALLASAGFTEIRSTAEATCDGDLQSTTAVGAFWAQYYDSAELRRFLPAAGIATEAELTQASRAWREWGATPGASWSRFWCHAAARKPA